MLGRTKGRTTIAILVDVIERSPVVSPLHHASCANLEGTQQVPFRIDANELVIFWLILQQQKLCRSPLR